MIPFLVYLGMGGLVAFALLGELAWSDPLAWAIALAWPGLVAVVLAAAAVCGWLVCAVLETVVSLVTGRR